MFYFEQEVREEIEREKKKRRMEVARAERIRMLDEREGKSELVLSDQVSIVFSFFFIVLPFR